MDSVDENEHMLNLKMAFYFIYWILLWALSMHALSFVFHFVSLSDSWRTCKKITGENRQKHANREETDKKKYTEKLSNNSFMYFIYVEK